MMWPRLRVSGRTLAAAIVALAMGGAVVGTATGARVAAEAAPPAETTPPGDPASEPPAAYPLPPQRHRVLGRVLATRGQFLRVRTPSGEIARVHVLPRAVIRKAGQPVSMDALERGDRILAVGRVNQNGVLQARGVVTRPTPLARPAATGETRPDGDPSALGGATPAPATP